MPLYETIFIAKPQLTDTEVVGILDKTKKLIAQGGGEILAEDQVGRRKLAYPIERSREGFYVMLKFQSPTSVLEKLNHHYHVSDGVLRSMTMRLELPKKEGAGGTKK